MKYQLRLAAIGGQGILTAGTLLTHIAVDKEAKHAAESPTYTSAVRGEPTKVDIVISDNPILFPSVTEVDFFLCTEQSTFNAFKDKIKDNAIVVVDSELVSDLGDAKQWKLYSIPLISQTKIQLGSLVFISVVSLAITQKLTNIVKYESMIEYIKEWAPKGLVEQNIQALEVGRNLV